MMYEWHSMSRSVAVMGALCLLLTLTLSTTLDPDDPARYSIPDTADICQRPWRSILKVDETGHIVHGSVEAVKLASRGGHLLRIKLYLSDGLYLLNVDNSNVRGDHVCAESLWHVTHNGTHISTEVEWRYHLLCTDAHVWTIQSPFSRPDGWSISNQASYWERVQDAKVHFGEVLNETLPMVWYVKELGGRQPVYSHFMDGTRRHGALDDLRYMARCGEVRGVMRDRGYTFSINSIVLDDVNKVVNGLSVGHVSQAYTRDSLTFRQPPYYWFSSWITNGRRDNSRWLVGTTQPRGHNQDHVALDWHVDCCWREVYVNDNFGEWVSGSLDELICAVNSGHRLRVHYEDTVLEANSVRVMERTVIAQSIEQLERQGGTGPDQHFIHGDTKWQWTTVHTTGTVKVYRYRVVDMSRLPERSISTTVRWVVDTRPWRNIFNTPIGQFDDFNRLTDAVKAGASIRFRVQQDPLAGDFFTNADNVRLDEVSGMVFAQCLRHISDQKDPTNQREYKIQASPFYWFLMISSEGVMAMSAWKTQTRTQSYDSVAPQVNMSWFASD